jgi:hypothetical protein
MKKVRFILVLAAISLVCSLNAQLRVAVLIVGDYNPSSFEYQWNGGNLNGQNNWKEFWNDTYLLWELLIINPPYELGYGYDYIYVYFANGEDYDQGDLDERYKVPPGATFTDAAASLYNVQQLLTGLATGIGNFPQLEHDDFLFIWTMGHGGNDENGSYMNLYGVDVLTDVDFGNRVNSITAQKKVIFMQQGYAGGFANNLTGNNVIFYSACDDNTNAYQADDIPYLENEILGDEEETYYHGEFDFHTYSPMAGKSPDGVLQYNGIHYSTADADVNRVVSIDEIHNWETNWTGIGSFFQDPGGIASTTSLKYPNILPEIVSSDLVLSGYIGITTSVRVATGVTLTFDYDSEVYLDYEGELIIDEGATLIIRSNSKINSYCNYGNRKIIINGNLIVEPNLTFMSLNPIGDTLFG